MIVTCDVLCKKRLQLLDEIIAAEGYEDVNLARDMWAGFDLVGTSPVSNVLPGKVTPASLHPDDLCAAAPRANEALKASLGKMSSCGIRLCKKWLPDGSLVPISPLRIMSYPPDPRWSRVGKCVPLTTTAVAASMHV